MVAFSRQMLSMVPSRGIENANIGISALKLFKRLGLETQFAKEWELIKDHCDACLVRAHSVFLRDGEPTLEWWKMHRNFAGWILPTAAMDICMEAEGDWQSIAEHVWAVHDNSAVGQKLMAGAVRQLGLEKITLRSSGLLSCS